MSHGTVQYRQIPDLASLVQVVPSQSLFLPCLSQSMWNLRLPGPPAVQNPYLVFGYEPQHSWNSLPRWFHGKESTYNAGVSSSISGSGRSPERENGNPLQDSCLENPMREEPGCKEEAGRLQSVGSKRVRHMVYEHLAF